MNVFLIPGNPPASYFYERWLSELTATGVLEKGHFHIYPMFKEEKNPTHYWQKVLDFYEEKLAPLNDVLLIGHSVGGKVALDLMQRDPQNIKKCILLFPFLRRPGVRGKLVLEGVSRLHQLMGSGVFLKSKKALSLFSKELPKLSNQEVESCLHLLTCERETIGKTESLKARKDPRVEILYTQKDTWCPPTSQAEFSKIFSSKEVKASHDFVIYEQERARLTDELLELVKNME